MKTFTVVGEAWGDNWFVLKPETCNNTMALQASFRNCLVLVPLDVLLGTKVKFAFEYIKDGVTKLIDYKEI